MWHKCSLIFDSNTWIMNPVLQFFLSLFSVADGAVDSGQGSSVYTESCVSSQQTVSYGSQHDQPISTAAVQGYAASVGQVQSQQHGGYQPPTVVSQNLKVLQMHGII